jgi:putative sterol carrier protein
MRKQYARLTPLVRNTALKKAEDLDVGEAAKAILKSFEQGRDSGSFEIEIVGDRTPPQRFEFGGGKASLNVEPAGNAAFAIKADRTTMMEMARGTLSPVDAYLGGRMEVHGDLDVGKRVFARLAAKGGEREL